ncbi:MAG: twin-arginine translocase TatA/TatE family subunit [Deltaproteobacteria bacterium]|nr:twin-arginine translocase TatA/TatE family subunit [Deltaproteobacteria bacterium]
MFGIGFMELIVIGIVGILVFGSKLPEVARGLGIFIRKTQRLFQEIKYDIEDEVLKKSPDLKLKDPFKTKEK